MILILANVFIAIMCDAYNAVNNTHKDEEFGINFGLKTIMKKFQNFGTFFNTSFSSIDKNNDGIVNHKELAKCTGLNQKDAQLVINTFDKNKDNCLDKHEMAQARRMLSNININNNTDIEQKLTDVKLSVPMNDIDNDREISDLEISRSLDNSRSIDIYSINLSNLSDSNQTDEGEI